MSACARKEYQLCVCSFSQRSVVSLPSFSLLQPCLTPRRGRLPGSPPLQHCSRLYMQLLTGASWHAW